MNALVLEGSIKMCLHGLVQTDENGRTGSVSHASDMPPLSTHSPLPCPLPVGAVAITSPHHSMLYAVALRTEAFPLMQAIIRGSLHQVYIYIMKWEVLGIASDEFDKLGIDVIHAFAETVFPSPQKGPFCPFNTQPVTIHSSCLLSSLTIT